MPPFKADVEESSPKMVAEDAKTNGANGEKVKEEDIKEEEEDGDIYAEAALQCSIENKDACIMCSG